MIPGYVKIIFKENRILMIRNILEVVFLSMSKSCYQCAEPYLITTMVQTKSVIGCRSNLINKVRDLLVLSLHSTFLCIEIYSFVLLNWFWTLISIEEQISCNEYMKLLGFGFELQLYVVTDHSLKLPGMFFL